MPTVGKATSGKTGALAYKSLATGGTLKYIPHGGFGPTESRGDALVPLVNNTAFTANKVRGLSYMDFVLAVPFIPAIMTADFWARLIGSAQSDDDQSNYHQITNFPDNIGSPADNYNKCKFGSWSGSIQSSVNGAAQVVGMNLSGMCIDPQGTAPAALAAPSSGPVSLGGIKGFAETEVAQLGDDFESIGWQIGTGLIITSGKVIGTTAKYPWLPRGLLQTDIAGIISIRQERNAATVLGSDGNDFTLTIAIGSAGDGVVFTFDLMPLVLAKPSGTGVNYVTSRYGLKSVSGGSPVSFTAM